VVDTTMTVRSSSGPVTSTVRHHAIGPIGASAIDAMLPNPQVFKSGRHYAAFLELTPRKDSSGKTVKRSGIANKGDTYLRRMLVQGRLRTLAKVRSGQVKGASAWVLRMAAHPSSDESNLDEVPDRSVTRLWLASPGPG
jgi:transposase